jgi:hypothetical protein
VGAGGGEGQRDVGLGMFLQQVLPPALCHTSRLLVRVCVWFGAVRGGGQQQGLWAGLQGACLQQVLPPALCHTGRLLVRGGGRNGGGGVIDTAQPGRRGL